MIGPTKPSPKLKMSHCPKGSKSIKQEGRYLVRNEGVMANRSTCAHFEVLKLSTMALPLQVAGVRRVFDIIITFKNVPTMHKFEHKRAKMNRNDMK